MLSLFSRGPFSKPSIRFLLLVLVAMASIYLGRFTFSYIESLKLFQQYAYWSITATFALFIFFNLRALRADIAEGRFRWAGRKVWIAGALTVFVATLFTVREQEPGFHMVMDDLLIAATSKQMHLDREADVPIRMVHLSITPTVLRSFVDKRPVFFPYLGSLFSDAFGFHPHNTIYLNIILSPLLYVVVFTFGYRLSGIAGGVTAVALIVSIPWLVLLANSGGLETLNMLMIVVTMILSVRFLEKPDTDRLGALCMSGILLAQSRYESVIFLLGVVVTIFYWWMRERRLQVPWVLFICPPLLIFYLLQNRVFENPIMWQMYSVSRGDTPFGLEYLPENLLKALYFFFSWDADMGNSMFASLAGIIAIICLLVYSLKRIKHFGSLSPWLQVCVLWFPAFLSVFGLLLMYGWEFDSPLTRRLALPLYIPLVFSVCILVFHVIKNQHWQRGFFFLLALYFLMVAYPHTSQRLYARMNSGAVEVSIAEKYLQSVGDKRVIFVSEMPFLYSLYNKDTIHTNSVNKRLGELKWFLTQPGTPPMYYVDRSRFNPGKEKYESTTMVSLNEQIETEIVHEVRYSTLSRVSIQKIIGVKDVEANAPDEKYKTYGEYMRFWAENIP